MTFKRWRLMRLSQMILNCLSRIIATRLDDEAVLNRFWSWAWCYDSLESGFLVVLGLVSHRSWPLVLLLQFINSLNKYCCTGVDLSKILRAKQSIGGNGVNTWTFLNYWGTRPGCPPRVYAYDCLPVLHVDDFVRNIYNKSLRRKSRLSWESAISIHWTFEHCTFEQLTDRSQKYPFHSKLLVRCANLWLNASAYSPKPST